MTAPPVVVLDACVLYRRRSAISLCGWRPFVLTMAPGMGNRPLGVFSTFFPARSAQIELNARFAPDTPWLEMRGDRQSTSACLAWSETWVAPRG